MEKTYTQDWFDRCIPTWEKYLAEFKGKKCLEFLEIGSYEGRSTCWLLDNILTDESCTITCVDLWEESPKQGAWSAELYDRYDMHQVWNNFQNNTSEYGERVEAHCDKSQDYLRQFVVDPLFDCIYIDGSHISYHVIQDIVLSWPLLYKGGLMILDDYTWDFFGDPRRHPKMAIDAFLAIYEGQYEILYKDQQIILRKVAECL